MVIKDKEYIDFSVDLHNKKALTPTVVQIELTYKCPLKCAHCYTDCYNNKDNWDKELSTSQVKTIIDKCKKAGVLWICFTGGDPMMREDFVELYDYAFSQGLIVNVFSSLLAMDEEIFEKFIEKPPFKIETTLNAANTDNYEEITGTKLFEKHLEIIKKLSGAGLNVIVKAMATKQNYDELDKIKELFESLGQKFEPSADLFATLNKDNGPCSLRLEPKQVVKMKDKYFDVKIDKLYQEPNDNLFHCSVGLNDFYISPEGKMFLCNCLREPSYDLTMEDSDVEEGFKSFNSPCPIIQKSIVGVSKCKDCRHKHLCGWCTGRAGLENLGAEEESEYYCKLVDEIVKNEKLKMRK